MFSKTVCNKQIPGFFQQPTRAVRAAFWLSVEMSQQGWVLHDVGDRIAVGGFIAEKPCGTLVIVRRNTSSDGMEPGDRLAGALGRLSFDERDYLRRLLASGYVTSQGDTKS